MMEKNIKYWQAMSDRGIIGVLGDFIQQTRLHQNKMQEEVAVAAGVNRPTIVQIEKGGGGTITSYIQVLGALEQLQLFQHFELTDQPLSPLQLAKIEQKKRQRASNKKNNDLKKQASDW